MKHIHYLLGSVAIVSSVWYLGVRQNTDTASISQQSTETITHSPKPAQKPFYKELPRNPQLGGKADQKQTEHVHSEHCSHTTSHIAAEKNSATWPQVVIDHLKEKHPTAINGINHLRRAVSYNTFEQLNPEQLDRLITYSEFAQQATIVTLPNLCWSHNTPPPVQSSFDQVRALAISEIEVEGEIEEAQQGNDRWTRTATNFSTGPEGTPITITWSFVPDGTTTPGGTGQPSAPSNLIATLNSTYGTSSTGRLQDAPWFELFDDSFAEWGEATGNTYIFEPNDDGASISSFSSPGIRNIRGDVRIAGLDIDGNSGTLAFNFFPNGGDMVIDTNDSANFTNNAITRVRLRNVIAHEHGHGLGISHVCPVNQTKLMEPFVSTSFSGVQFDELITSQGLYGDTMEASGNNTNNNTIANAAQLGTIEGSFQVENLSIANANDVDIYRFNVTSGQRLTLNISPTDESPYLEGAQNSDGSCSAGTSFNPQNRQNLSVRLIAPNGSTELATANSAPIGQGENITNLLLPQAGEDYFIEVTGGGENNNANNNAQVYSLTLNVEPASTLTGSNYQIIEEGCSPANQRVDPGEIVTAQITVTNTGVTPIASPSVSVSGSSNFTALDGSTKSLSNLAVGAATTVDFQFRVDGICGAEEALEFTLNTASETFTFNQSISLGVGTDILSTDFDAPGSGFTPENSGINSASDWGVQTGDPIRGARSVFSAGSTSNSNFFLVSPTRQPNEMNQRVTFTHNYDFEDGFDGGTLEVQIDGGAWQEWTAAGGSFSQNGYNGSIQSGPAWTSTSDGNIITIANLPNLPNNSTIRLRWNAFHNDSNPSQGWLVDDISLSDFSCCEGNTPMVSISSPDPIAQENDLSNTGEFSITISEAPITNLNVAYTASGSATAGSDYQALAGIATINSGEQLATIPVTAIRDSLAEGNETLTLTLATSPNYAIQTGTASVTIEDLPIDEWRNSFFGTSTVNTGDTDDFDLDGLSNLLEYALGGDPRVSNAEQPSASLQNGGSQLTLSYEEDTRLTDIEYIVEVSPTLGDGDSPWVTTGVSISEGPTVNGKRTVTASTTVNSTRQFMRLRVVRN